MAGPRQMWQTARASASAASAGLGGPASRSTRATIAPTWAFSARPEPVTAALTSLGVWSATGSPRRAAQSIATALAHGLQHYRAGRVSEALWWWQFSYVSTWGNEASGVLRALQSVVAHDRLDTEFESEQDQVAAADELLTP